MIRQVLMALGDLSNTIIDLTEHVEWEMGNTSVVLSTVNPLTVSEAVLGTRTF